jgi:hypothetical protein
MNTLTTEHQTGVAVELHVSGMVKSVDALRNGVLIVGHGTLIRIICVDGNGRYGYDELSIDAGASLYSIILGGM